MRHTNSRTSVRRSPWPPQGRAATAQRTNDDPTHDRNRPTAILIRDRRPHSHRRGLALPTATIPIRDRRKASHARIFRGLQYYHRSVAPSRHYRIIYARKNIRSPNTNDISHRSDQRPVSKIRAHSLLVLIVARNQSTKGLLLEFCYLNSRTLFSRLSLTHPSNPGRLPLSSRTSRLLNRVKPVKARY